MNAIVRRVTEEYGPRFVDSKTVWSVDMVILRESTIRLGTCVRGDDPCVRVYHAHSVVGRVRDVDVAESVRHNVRWERQVGVSGENSVAIVSLCACPGYGGDNPGVHVHHANSVVLTVCYVYSVGIGIEL